MNEVTNGLKNRQMSIDALRGLAMFLILSIDIGGAPIFKTFTALLGQNFASAAAVQFQYGFVKGLRLSFIAMPMFLFVVGVVIPLSVSGRLLKTEKKKLYLHIIRRSLILFLFGLIAGGHLLELKFKGMPLYNNVLEYIAIGYLVCGIIVMNTSIKFQIVLTSVLLVLYWLAFVFIPVPGWEGDIYSDKMNLAIYIDNIVLGQFHRPGSWQVLATVNFISNMMIGVLAGHIMKKINDNKKVVRLLLIYGLSIIILGIAWGYVFPIIRNLWTSSFVLVTCGISLVLLAIFKYLIDVCNWKKWSFFFVVFGVNSITIYMMAHLFDFRLIGNIFIGGFSRLFSPPVQDFIQALGAMTVMWLSMYFLYRKKIFLKI